MDFAAFQSSEKGQAAVLDQRHFDRWMGAAVALEEARKHAFNHLRRGADPEAARQTAGMMVTAVEFGALGSAYVPGYTIGGKTGTAETGSGDPHAWFIGFIGWPGEPPRYAVAVIVEAGGGGGQVALPIGRDLLVAAMNES